jgi:hypothetical protein
MGVFMRVSGSTVCKTGEESGPLKKNENPTKASFATIEDKASVSTNGATFTIVASSAHTSTMVEARLHRSSRRTALRLFFKRKALSMASSKALPL